MNEINHLSHLTSYKERLQNFFLPFIRTQSTYSVPELWIAGKEMSKIPKQMKINPTSFFLNALDWIIKQKPTPVQKGKRGEWTRSAVIYNMFVRTTTALDHNGSGKLELPLNKDGWRETGTFLKAFALLPYIKSLGANTIHLLPITAIGSDGNKGTLGSPYAIKNPYKLDENLHEPNAGLGVEEEFKLFVHAAHHLGMRVVVEFVFRTSAKDGDWVKEHPDWVYWIKENIKDRQPGSHDEPCYGNPIFTDEELKTITSSVKEGALGNLLPPHTIYREMFTESPKKETIRSKKGHYIGQVNGSGVRVPGAFADWPPNDSQPPWGDVTYLKMYNHSDFNYIAYNTIRMYDTRLAKRENINKELWETIAEIIPHYQHTYGIDGVMIDMGHALPMELKQDMIHRARSIDIDFAFWDENFSVSEKSVQEGYNAVIGYQWSDQHHPQKFKNLLRRFAKEGYPITFFATPESHNTPRAAARDGGITYSKYAWALSNFIPAVPFIHSGVELGEVFPINTGLDFTKEDLPKYPSEKLPLFSEYAYDWLNKYQWIDWAQKISSVRKKYEALIMDSSKEAFHWIETEPSDLIAFLRKGKKASVRLLVVANSNMSESIQCVFPVESSKPRLKDLLSDKFCAVKTGNIECTLSPGQVSVFEV